MVLKLVWFDFSFLNFWILRDFEYKPPLHKTYKMTCAQQRLRSAWASTWVWSGFSLSAWRNLGTLATHWAPSKDSDWLGRCPGWSESLLGVHVILLVLSCTGSYLRDFECPNQLTGYSAGCEYYSFSQLYRRQSFGMPQVWYGDNGNDGNARNGCCKLWP